MSSTRLKPDRFSAACRADHAVERAAERYGVDLGGGRLAALELLAASGDPRAVALGYQPGRARDPDRLLVAFHVDGVWVGAVFDARLNQIRTFLPPHAFADCLPFLETIDPETGQPRPRVEIVTGPAIPADDATVLKNLLENLRERIAAAKARRTKLLNRAMARSGDSLKSTLEVAEGVAKEIKALGADIHRVTCRLGELKRDKGTDAVFHLTDNRTHSER